MNPDEFLDLAVDAARQAGSLLLERWRGPASGVVSKSTPTDLVSDADRDSEELLVGLIEKHRPEDGILSEEGAESDWEGEYRWVLDPLDGTVNYLFGLGVWAVSIAVEDRDGAVVGVTYDATRDEMFTAVRGDGAKLNGRAISVSDKAELGEALVGTGFSYDASARAEQAQALTRILPKVRDIRRAGSAAIDQASLACGRLDGFYEAPLEYWDKAAGRLLITEAGGVVSELPGPKGLSPGMVAAGPRLHDGLRDLVVSSIAG